MDIDFNNIPSYIKNEVTPKNRGLGRGRKGKEVRRVQEWLDVHGFKTAIDGDFGPATVFTLKRFQESQGISITGVINDETWQLLSKPIESALIAPKNMPKSIPDLVRLFAEMHLDQYPHEIGGANRGPWVRLYCDGQDGEPWAWCAGFVSLIVNQAYYYAGQKSPIKGSVSCDILASQGKSIGHFIDGRDIVKGRKSLSDLEFPLIFLLRRTNTDWVHAGFAMKFEDEGDDLVFSTIEGNTNSVGHREGIEACRRTRSLASGKYDFVSPAALIKN